MVQYARPSADTLIGNYEDEGAGTTNIYQSIDEVSANDSDYIISDSAPSSSPYVCALSSVTDPGSSANHTVRYRYAKDLAAGSQVNLTVELRQGYVSEVSQGTLIASNSHTDISNTITAGSFTLSAGEADSITNYASLFLRFVYNQV